MTEPNQISSSYQEYAHLYRRKTRLELIRISAAVMGIEFCYAAETAFVSPTMLKIGISHAHMTLIWCLSPIIGFFLTPILGSLSDGCYLRMGRRRPFILALSVGIVMGLLLVPNGNDMGIAMGDLYLSKVEQATYLIEYNESGANSTWGEENEHRYQAAKNDENQESHPWSIFFTVIGTVLLDFNADACQSPSRAYMLDVTVPEDHAIGLSTFTIMAGLGGSMGYAMGAINWDTTSIGHTFGGHVRSVFSVILFIFIGCVTITVFSFKEIPLDMLNLNKVKPTHFKKTEVNINDPGHKCISKNTILQRRSCSLLSFMKGYKRFSNDLGEDDVEIEPHVNEKSASYKFDNYGAISGEQQNKETSFNDDTGGIATPTKNLYSIEKESSFPEVTPDGTTSLFADSHQTNSMEEPIQLKEYLYSIIYLPSSLKMLCLTNLFCWMSIVSYSLYFTDFVGEAVFNGDPKGPVGSSVRELYEEGIRYGCWGMSVYSLSCSAYSFLIDKLIFSFKTKRVYIGGQLVYSIGMLLLATTRHKLGVILLSSTTGVMYATVFTIPYILVAEYHTHKIFDTPGKSANLRGIGTDVAIVSSMIFLAQFILSACMGAIINITGATETIIIFAAILSFCGAICATRVTYCNV